MRNDVGLHVAVIVLAGPHISTFPTKHACNHVVDEPMLVGEASLVELLFKFLVEHFLEQILEPAVVCLQDGVFGAEEQRIVALQRVIHGCASKVTN